MASTERRGLYPQIEPYEAGTLDVGDGHRLYWERCGTPGAAAILIGPEGGFTEEERAAIRALPQARPISLGPRILRADTAALAAVSLWMARAGDWTSPPARR